ncbi:Por secretion system C-terminal sorting domain-containing protein [Flavobacterium micromati]|uniref:Por secretion system C-terminal sorting domain-containing protein n=1 Tax=Flavobacterium micromati TaxID=229205 RepID=A0A1M5QMR8_9FLAO|nr:endonuclease [Flavobacterium micromati]SHH15385.1 Por secretion system C-terminal sorting domain-containing protein [Flavobacterium micromati]
MKQIYSLFFLFLFTAGFAQAPANYYSTATGSGYTLKTQLHNIIKDHTVQSYAGLYVTYETSDIDNFFENDGSVLDMYSENPAGADPYNYSIAPAQRCGNAGYNAEGDCYNREHIIPQSIFNEASPMVSDAHFITPTDGEVNGIRSNFPHSVVAIATQTTLNGSKLGASTTAGYTGLVFEPIDEFKGDIARMYFYFATRYQNTVAGYNFPMFNNSTNKVFTNAFLSQLIAWHNQDPVSAREIARNNAIYARQNNRNPYIDNPLYVAAVWTTEPADTEAPTAATNLLVTTTTSNSATLTWTAATDNIGVTGYDLYVDGVFKSTHTGLTATVTGLLPSTTYGFSIITRDDERNSSVATATATGTTTAIPGGTTTCAFEDFQTIPGNATSYTNQTWSNSGITWTATDARTDQTLNLRALTIRNGSLTSSTVPNGIKNLTVTTQLIFAGSAGTFKLNVNGIEVGTIPYSSALTTTTISGINVTGNVIVTITGNSSTSNRVRFDDLSWTCENSLSTTDFNSNDFTIYPNPSNGNVKINFTDSNEKHQVQIFSVLGQKVFEKEYSNSSTAVINSLSTGVYIVKITKDNKSETKKLIVN